MYEFLWVGLSQKALGLDHNKRIIIILLTNSIIKQRNEKYTHLRRSVTWKLNKLSNNIHCIYIYICILYVYFGKKETTEINLS